jgi:signal transduction histidine kinase
MKRRIPLLRSVFTQLLAILLVAGLAINGSVIVFFGAIRHKATDSYNPHLLRYVDYLIADIGLPPDLDRARKIAGDTGMVIHYDADQTRWSTGSDQTMMPLDRYRIWYHSDHLQAGSRHGNHFVRRATDDGTYTFILPFDPAVEKRIKILGLGLLVFISLVLAGALLAMRHIMRPLRWLQHGVERVGAGDLDSRVPTRGANELHSLARAFNDMTGRLKTLIQTKDRLLVDVSHELRSPITRMRLAATFLPDGDAKRSIVEDLREMETMVTAILDAARTQNAQFQMKKETTDLVRIIGELVDTMAVTPPGIVFDPPEQPILLTVDPRQMRTAIKNVIENGQKYAAAQSEPVAVSVRKDSGQVTITVSDRGIGIPEEERERIFEPFYRVDKSRTRETGGFGLGLSICKNIVKAHGGRIQIDSPPTEGTTVRIVLPVP